MASKRLLIATVIGGLFIIIGMRITKEGMEFTNLTQQGIILIYLGLGVMIMGLIAFLYIVRGD